MWSKFYLLFNWETTFEWCFEQNKDLTVNTTLHSHWVNHQHLKYEHNYALRAWLFHCLFRVILKSSLHMPWHDKRAEDRENGIWNSELLTTSRFHTNTVDVSLGTSDDTSSLAELHSIMWPWKPLTHIYIEGRPSPPASGGRTCWGWLCPLLGVASCHQCQSWATVNLLYCVHCELIGTSDNVRWQQLMLSLLASWQTALSVKMSRLKLNLSLARPVNKRQRGDTMQFIWLTNIDGTHSLPAGMLLSPQLAAPVKTQNLPPDWP